MKVSNYKYKDRIIFLIIIFIYKLLLDIIYVHIISQYYSYAGLYLEINNIKIAESYIILFFLIFILKINIKKPSDFFILYLFCMLVIPLLTIYSFQNKSRIFIYMILFSFLTIKTFSNINHIKIKTLKHGSKYAIFISYFIGTLLLIWILIKGGWRYLNFNLFKVYDFRRTVASLIFPGKLSYIMTWFGNVINPVLIAFYLWRKNYKKVFFTVVIQILFFSLTAHKSILFYPFLIFFVFIFGNKYYFAQMLPLGLSIITMISSGVYVLFKDLTLVTLLIRRVLFVTANNHYRYYDTFQELGFLYFSTKDWVPKIIQYPFAYPVPLVISKIYYGHTDTWINTGFLATGYMNLGFLGMIFYSALVGLIFSFIDNISKYYLPKWLCIAVMIVPINNLLNADLFTALLSHGILLAIIMLWLISDKKSIRKNIS